MKLNRKMIALILAVIAVIILFRRSREMLQGDDKSATIKKMIDYVNANKTSLSKDPFYVTSKIIPYVTDKSISVKLIEASGKNDDQTIISILKSL